MQAFKDLLPYWAARGHRVPKFVEVKSNLRRAHVRMLRDAGVKELQPGIESLADRTLKLMKKGVSAAQNVAMLRWCAEAGIRAHWNLIFGFPGEDPGDAKRTIDLMGKLVHLDPPDGCAPVRMDRFSPNLERYREHGFTRVEPVPAYRHILPMTAEQIERAASFFLYDHPRYAEGLEAGLPMVRQGHRWRDAARDHRNGRLVVAQGATSTPVLVDERLGYEPMTTHLTPSQTALLLACDSPTTAARAVELAAKHVSGTDFTTLRRELDELISRDLICEIGASILSLPVMPDDLVAGGLQRTG